jgi:hypothetical protein
MPKIVGTRERVHQPFYDSLIRVDGGGDLRQGNVGVFGAVQSRSQLFVRQGADVSVSNLTTGGFFPSDQTFVTLAVRVWTYFRFNAESTRFQSAPVIANAPVASLPGVTADRIQRVHKLYHQAENQLFWQFIAGDKPQLTTFTMYTPAAGGLDGFFSDTRLSPIGQSAGSSIIEQLNGQVPDNDPWGAAATGGTITGTPGATGLTVTGRDDIAKDVKYLIDGIHSRDVL